MKKNTSKEIEYGTKIKNSKTLVSYLNTNAINQGSIKTTRKIFKKEGSNYFFRTDHQVKNSKKSYIFTIKENILDRKGVKHGMKVSDEIDLEVSKLQLQKLEGMVSLLGFTQNSIISTTRRIYFVDKMMVTIDSYSDNEYLEVEGNDRKKIMNLVSKLPIEKI